MIESRDDGEYDPGRDLAKNDQGQNSHYVVADSPLRTAGKLVVSSVYESYP